MPELASEYAVHTYIRNLGTLNLKQAAILWEACAQYN